MGVYIKGMEMPKNCGECLLAKLSPTGESLICNYMLSRVSWEERPFDCHLVPVPPHGRLGDLDAVAAEIQSAIDNMEYSYPYLLREAQSQREHGMVFAEDIVRYAPTIIPAEEGEA